MSKLYLTTFALAALSVIGIDSAVSAAQQQTKENRTVSTVSGRVTLKDEPMPGVTVSLQQQQNTLVTAAGNLLAKTDANGVYHITGVAPGRYRIRAVAAGYISNDSSQGFSGGNGRPLIVGENEALDNIDLEMKRGGVITGRITDPNGHPLVEERVNLKIVAGNSRPPANFPLGYPDLYSTDDRGVYRIYGLPEGSYLVSAGFSPESPDPYMSRNSGPLYPLTYYPDTSDQTQAKPVEVGEGAEVTGIDIVLGEAKKTYSIAGRVVLEETQQPISGVALSLGMVSPDGRVMQMWYGESARSNAGGEFRLQGVTKGKYAVVARTDEGVEGYSDPVYCEVDESDV
ncbi:MAG: carboxypeptidase regulatory-like domain-containing protein, partial [Blastocatellia bacterium]|nr:carboxypeptidase regulatory-like domain-containing protein [Blastocatellia bacterium]